MKLFLRIMLVANVCICLLFQLNANPKEFIQKNYFIENKGQWDKDIRFLARVNGMNAWITNDGVVYDFYTFGEGRNNDELGIRNYELEEGTSLNGSQFTVHGSQFTAHGSQFTAHGSQFTAHGSRKGHVVQMSFVGDKKLSESYSQQFDGFNKSKTYYNYFIGNDKSKWASNVPLYEEVIIKNVYAGIDFRFYFENGMLRYDLNISPFADLNKIKMKFDGQESLDINDNGELVIGTSIGNVHHQQLYAWQDVQDKKINCNFRIDENGLVGFKANDYKKDVALVIDPLVFSTYMGGDDLELILDQAVDKLNNLYITGFTGSYDFPIKTGAYQEKFNGELDAFVSKINYNGTLLVFSTFIGGKGSREQSTTIGLDDDNKIYIAGFTKEFNSYQTSFPVTPDAYDTSYNGEQDMFFSIISDNGSSLIYSTLFGGSKDDICSGIAIDENKNIFLIGNTLSPDFPTTSGAFDTSFNDSTDIFVSKFDSTGLLLEFSTFIGGSNHDKNSAILLDNKKNIFIVGETYSYDFPVTKNVFDTSFNNGSDIVVANLSQDGSTLLKSTYIGGSFLDSFYGGAAIDSSGFLYFTGQTSSNDFPVTTGILDDSYNNNSDVFVTKVSNDLESIIFSTFIGGNDSEGALSLAVDRNKDIYIVGSTNSLDFPATSDEYSTGDHTGNFFDAFFCKIDNAGTSIIYSTLIGGSLFEGAYNVNLDEYDNVFISGYTVSKDFPITPNAIDSTHSNNWDGFVCKLQICDEYAFNFPNFQFTDNFNFVRDAKAENKALVLTPSEPWQKGAVWYKEKVPIKKGFTTTFSFRISEGVNDFDHEQYSGADGFAFVIQNYSPDAIGSSGGGIGYSGIPNSLAVEFDTYKNDGVGQNDLNDKDENHFHIFSNGTLPNTSDHSAEIPYSSGMPEESLLIPNGREIFGKIEYNMSKENYRMIWVHINSTPDFEKDSGSAFGYIFFIDTPLDLDSEEFVWVGFTSATGNAYEKHEILSWSFCPTPTNAVLVGVENDEIISESSENLLDIFPNPAFDLLNIEYSLANPGNVSIEVFDVLGNKIKVVDYGFVESGRHHVILSLSKDEQTGLSYFPSGMYYLVLRNNEKSVYGKFGVMK